MKNFYLVMMTIGLGLASATAQARAESPAMHWGSDTRAMSQQECMKRARFAMGEQGLQVSGQDGSDVAGSGSNVTVLVTCFPLGQRTFISVVAASPDGGTAARFRNGVRSLVMGPAN
jgi:hypothetical protein